MDTEIAKLSKFTFSEQKGGTMNTVNQIPYEYSNLPIPGGGYVTGFLFHPQRGIQCLSPAKKYKLYKSSINKSIHFVQRSLSSSTRGRKR